MRPPSASGAGAWLFKARATHFPPGLACRPPPCTAALLCILNRPSRTGPQRKAPLEASPGAVGIYGARAEEIPKPLIPEEKQERRKEKVTFPPSDDVSGCIAWVWRTPCPGLPRTFRMRARKVPGHQNSLRPGQPGMAGHPSMGLVTGGMRSALIQASEARSVSDGPSAWTNLTDRTWGKPSQMQKANAVRV